jgi:hypothetical protein
MIGHMVFGDMKKIIDDKMENASEAIYQQAKLIHRLVCESLPPLGKCVE